MGIDDALSYMKDVEQMFKVQRDKIDTFGVILKDFDAKRTDIHGVIARVKVLFKGHNNLIFGFNTFLPKGLEIALDDEVVEEAPPPKKADRALALVNNIKVSNLFEGHPDLLEEFIRYLPEFLAPHSAALLIQSQAQRYDDPGSAPPPVVPQVLIDNDRQADTAVASPGDRDHSVDCSDLIVDKQFEITLDDDEDEEEAVPPEKKFEQASLALVNNIKVRIANQIGMLLPRVTMIIVLTVLTFNVDKEKRVEKEDRERINHALGDGEAEEQALVSEIKDLKKKSQKESNIPHLEYEYLDRSIHEDLFKLVQFSCEEMWSNKEKMGKVLRLWNSFLELMLGVPASKDVTTTCCALKPPQKDEEIGNGAADKRSGDVDERVFYGNEDFYVLFRLHRILYERISLAKTYCTGGGEMNGPGEIQKILLVHHILMQGIPYKPNRFENHEFEDECRAIIGNQSYVLFILDKLLYRLVKQQLQAVVADNVDNKLLQLYESGKSRNTVYYENARILLHDENIYRMECVRTLIQSPHYVSPLRNSLLFIDPENLFQSSSPPRLSIQLMD
ncbi:hypothetical protein Bca4012_046186 [Brassica carinata]